MSNQFYFDPYIDVIHNPLTNQKFSFKKLLWEFEYDECKTAFNKAAFSEMEISFESFKSTTKLKWYWLKNLNRLFSLLIIIGPILGFIISTVSYSAAILSSLSLIYFSVAIFDLRNGVRAVVEASSWLHCVPIWIKYRNLFFFLNWLMLITLLITSYLITDKWYIPLVIYVVSNWLIINPFIRTYSSHKFKVFEIISDFEEILDDIQTKELFQKSNPSGIKMAWHDNYGDICEHDKCEIVALSFETAPEESRSAHVIVNSKIPVPESSLNRMIHNEDFLARLRKLMNEDLKEFFFDSLYDSDREDSEIPVAVFKKDPSYEYGDIIWGIGSSETLEENSNRMNVFSGDDLKFVINFKDGYRHGSYVEYYQNGKTPFLEAQYAEGLICDGKITIFHENGSVMLSGSLKSRKHKSISEDDFFNPGSEMRIGEWKYYDEEGNVKVIKRYHANKEIDTLLDESEGNLNWI